MADIKIRIQTQADTKGLDETKRKTDALKNSVGEVSEDFSKKLIGKAALAAAAFKGLQFAIGLVKPGLEGVRSAAGRVADGLGNLIDRTGAVQAASAGIRVTLETLAEFIESRVTPRMLDLANKINDVAARYSDAATAAGDLLRIQRQFKEDEAANAKGVEKEVKLIDVWLGRQKEVLAALRDNERARINLGVKDPVAREKALADVDRRFDAQGQRLEDQAANKKGGITQKEMDRLDEEILAAGAQLPQMGTLPKLAGEAQAAAAAEQAALRENRQNFVIRERIREMGGASVAGKTSFAQMAVKDREQLSPEDQLVYDFINQAGGMGNAPAAIESALAGSRKRLAGAKAERVDAFGRLPRGVGSVAEAATYENKIDLQMRGRIQDLQGQQDTVGEQAQDVLGSKVQRSLIAPIQNSTRDMEASAKLQEAFIAEQERRRKADQDFLETILRNEARNTNERIEGNARLKRQQESR